MYKCGANKRHGADMSRDDLHFRLRIPEEIKEWVRVQAEANRRSMTSEIVFLLETAMKKEKAGEPLTA
jgi:plasmid stability protein